MKITKKLKSKMKKVNRNLTRRLNKKQMIVLITVVGACSIVVVGCSLCNEKPKLENKPATVVKSVSDDGKERLFLERVDSLKSGIQDIGKLVFGEEKMSLSETFGTSNNNYIEVSGNFRVDYAIDIDAINVITDLENKKVTYEINQSEVKVNSVMLESEIKETYSHKSFGTKVIDIIPGLNKDEEIKETAINQLLKNSKVEANKFNKAELQGQAEKVFLETVKKLNVSDLDYKIKFDK